MTDVKYGSPHSERLMKGSREVLETKTMFENVFLDRCTRCSKPTIRLFLFWADLKGIDDLSRVAVPGMTRVCLSAADTADP